MKRLLIVSLFTFFSNYSWAQDGGSPLKSSENEKGQFEIVTVEKEVKKEVVKSSPFTAAVGLNYNSLSSTNGNSVSGPGAGVFFNYALYPKYGVGLGLRQMSLSPSGSASSINVRFTYAYKGSLHSERSKSNYNNSTVVESKTIEERCICLQAMVSQIYFNGTSSTVPFTGYGLGGYYKMPTKKRYSYIFGGIYESTVNVETVTNLSFQFNIEFRI